MTRRADRLFQIVQILRGRRLTTAAHLAERLEVSPRTIYRDICDLSLSGVPVEGEAGSGYRLMAGFDLPPLMLTHRESEALMVAMTLELNYILVAHLILYTGLYLPNRFWHCIIVTKPGNSPGEMCSRWGYFSGESTGYWLHGVKGVRIIVVFVLIVVSVLPLWTGIFVRIPDVR